MTAFTAEHVWQQAEDDADTSVLVLGAGSIGLYLAATLLSSARRFRVRLLGRADGLAAAQQHGGLLLTDLFGSRRRVELEQLSSPCIAVSRSTPPRYALYPLLAGDAATTSDDDDELAAVQLAGRHRVFLVCGKSAATADMAALLRRAAPYVQRRPALVLSCQNGVDNARQLRELLPADVYAVVACVVGFNVTWAADAMHHVHRATNNPLVLHWRPAVWAHDALCGSLLLSLAEQLTRAGCKTLLVDDVESVQWAKLVVNLGNAVNALSGLPLFDQLHTAGYRHVGELIVDEALTVLRRAGVTVGRVGVLAPWLLREMLAAPQWLFALLATVVVKIDRSANSSMQQDLHARRPTEIAELQGKIVQLARQCRTDAPVNRAVMQLVVAATDAAAGPPCLSPQDILAAIEREAGVDYVNAMRKKNRRRRLVFFVSLLLLFVIFIYFLLN